MKFNLSQTIIVSQCHILRVACTTWNNLFQMFMKTVTTHHVELDLQTHRLLLEAGLARHEGPPHAAHPLEGGGPFHAG